MIRWFGAIVLSVGLAGPTAAWELRICASADGMPYSHRDGGGFDNRIATVLADALGAEPVFVFMPDHRLKTARRHLHAGECDVVMGVLDGQAGFLTSHAYYRTGYVFVAPGPLPASLDDPSLSALRVGLPGGARQTTPPALALVRRGHLERLVFFGASAAPGVTEAAMLEALGEGAIDIAVLWGPAAGWLANGASGLAVALVTPEIDIPFMPMFASLAIGVRPHDEALRDAIDGALAERWDEVQAILSAANVPLLSLPRPVQRSGGRP